MGTGHPQAVVAGSRRAVRSPRGPQHRHASAPLQPTHLSALGCETEPCRSRPPPRSGAEQTEPSPRSQSGGSDYCGAQELTAASCGNYCCDGEAAAALHRARRHGVRPRGGGPRGALGEGPMGRKGNAASAALELLWEAGQAWHGSSHTSCWYCTAAVSYNCAL